MLNNYFHDPSIHHLNSARAIVPFLIQEFRPKSVIDIGCGNGNWLNVFQSFDVEDTIGVEGNRVDPNILLIAKEQIILHDLNKALVIDRKFDLVLCLEVAEHLKRSSADVLVESLVKLSNTIIFSAAIPGQGGQQHLNEQWPVFWKRKFEKYGFQFIDKFRNIFWNDANIDFWYKQNMFLVIKNEAMDRPTNVPPIMEIVHPDLLKRKNQRIESLLAGKIGIRTAFRIFYKSIFFKLSSSYK